ncbi:MAG: hydroxymethylpyrimidine/phosphomethylpyrimidine kinase [Candidatus Tokpelaia sp. JSC085]|nr:MAG: hydroxymethylpyrimidine/phosphomethylpyrimidine kinase [Candidatus Tokpelaia sp. JSC085]
MDTRNTTVAFKPVILIIAGTDSSGGAGVVRDIETATDLGVATALAVTAVTAQTHNKVLQIGSVSSRLIAEQIKSAFSSNIISAVKIGMSGTVQAIKAISSSLKKQYHVPIIFDPVLESSSKGRLWHGYHDDIHRAIVHDLLPMVTLITPNIAELAQLTVRKMATNEDQAIKQGKLLIAFGSRAVLVKGGHMKGDKATDHLLTKNLAPVRFSQKRINTTMRGTGCILATAIASNLALGLPLYKSVGKAKKHVLHHLQRKIPQ